MPGASSLSTFSCQGMPDIRSRKLRRPSAAGRPLFQPGPFACGGGVAPCPCVPNPRSALVGPPTCGLPRDKAPFGPLGDGGGLPGGDAGSPFNSPGCAGARHQWPLSHTGRPPPPLGLPGPTHGYVSLGARAAELDYSPARHTGCPPPPLGLPGPVHGIRISGCARGGVGLSSGPPGPGWQFGHGGGGSNGAALTSPTPYVSADMPTPVAIAAALAMRFTYIFGSSFPRLRCSPRWLPVIQAARRG